MDFLKEKINNDTGFFQQGKSFGGKGISGAFKGLANKFKDQPCAGQPGVCPYSCKPLQTPEEQQTGVSDEVRMAQGSQSMGLNPVTGREVTRPTMNGKFGAINQQLFNGGQA